MQQPNDFSRDVLFSRMIGLVSQQELDILAGKRVAVPGCGGTGYTYAECLVRMGVGGVNIADADTFGPENMNRQFGCSTNTIGRKKSEVLSERLLSINPQVSVQAIDYLDEFNVSDYLSEVDVVCDTLDFFVIKPRLLLYKEARRRNIPVVLCCPVAYGVTVHVFLPNSPTFEEFFDISDQDTALDSLKKFGGKLAPSKLYKQYIDSPKLDFEKQKVSSLSATCLMATSFGSMIAHMLLLGQTSNVKSIPHSYEFDLRALIFNENKKN